MPNLPRTFHQGAFIPVEWRDLSSLKSDTVDLTGTCIGIVIETAVDVKVNMGRRADDDEYTVVIPTAIWTSKGLFIEGLFTRVWATGSGAMGAIWGAFI